MHLHLISENFTIKCVETNVAKSYSFALIKFWCKSPSNFVSKYPKSIKIPIVFKFSEKSPKLRGGTGKIALVFFLHTGRELPGAALAVDPGEAMRAAARRPWTRG
jgi:hypothetical protein